MKKLVSCFLVVMLILNMILPVGLFAEEEIQPGIEKNSAIENDSEVGLDLETKENLSNENSLEISPIQIHQNKDAVTEVLPVIEAVGDAINFPDQNLFNGLINNGVDQNNDGVITQEEIKTATYLSLQYEGITNLTGLEYATELRELYLYGNTELSNIDPIKGLPQLETLNLSDTSVSDSDKISFVRLSDQNCILGYSNAQVIQPKDLSDAYTVSSSDESVVVATINNSNWQEWKIKLEAKKVGTAQVSIGIGTETKEFTVTVNGSPEGTIQFEDSNLFNALINNGIDQNSDGVITQDEIKEVTQLDLGYDRITSLTGLEYATALRNLYLYGNTDLCNIDPIKGLAQLETLNLRDTGVSDSDKISFVRVADQICAVGFSNAQVIQPKGLSDTYTISSSDEAIVVASIDNSSWDWKIKINAIKTGTAKVSLSIGTETKEFTVTVKAPPEGTIKFEDNNLFNALVGNGIDQNKDGAITQDEMKEVTSLNLGYKNITNLTGLEYATALRYLYLNGNSDLSNIDPIKGLIQLDTLNLRDTSVSDSDRMSFVRLPDQICAVGLTYLQFIQPNGVINACTISSSDQSIAVVSIDNSLGQGSKIKIEAKKTGTARVSVGIGTETKEFTVTVKTPPEGAIQFPDNNLFNALISDGVDQNKDGAITQEEMNRMIGISLANQNITNLTGLEYATELNYLNLYGNAALTNIDPIKGLTQLDTLDLRDTSVSDSDKMSFFRLPDQICAVGYSYFQYIKPNGLSNAFTVSSSDESVVKVTIDNSLWEGSKIKIDPKKTGTARVSVSVGTETKEFMVTVKTPPEGAIQFKDNNLFSALISEGVDQNNDGAITQDEMKIRTYLMLQNWDITNLTELEYATALKVIYLNGNAALTNIDPIKGLTELDTLHLRDTDVSDSDKMSFVRLPDQTCAVGYSYFQYIKPNGISNAFTASSSDESVVKVTIDNSSWLGSKIKMDPKKTGTARVSVLIGTETKEFTVTVKAPPEGAIQFPDNNLFNALISEGVDTNNDGTISSAELAILEQLNLQNCGITSLKGLEGVTSLKYLLLANNTELKDIEPIREIAKNLTSLYLGSTKVSTEDRISLMRIEDMSLNEGDSTPWDAKPIGVLDASKIKIAFANPEIAETNGYDYANIYIKAKKTGTTLATVTYEGVTKTFNLTVKPVNTGQIIGDVDNNAKVQAFDALMALQIATGKKVGTPAEVIAADVGNSGKVEAFDALRILQFATGKITKF